MTCREVKELLSSFVDQELAEEERRLVEEHVKDCADCQRDLTEIRNLKRALQSLPEVEPPAELHQMVMSAIKAEKRGKFLSFARKRNAAGEKGRFPGLRGWVRSLDYRRLGTALVAGFILVFVSSFGTYWLVVKRLGVGVLDSRERAGLMGKAAEDGSLERKDEGFTLNDEYGSSSAQAPVAPSSGAPQGAAEGLKTDIAGRGVKSLTGTGSLLPGAERKIVKRAYLSIELSRGQVQRASNEAMQVIEKNQGYVESSSMSRTDQNKEELFSFYMTARIPRENLDRAIGELSTLGKVVKQDLFAQDVTDQYVDLDARIRNKEVQEQRLLKILGEAKTVGEILQVESELSRVRADIESMVAQREVLEKSSDLSSLTLSITEEGALKPSGQFLPWLDVWSAFVSAWRNLFILIARITPGLVTIGVVVFAGSKVLRRKL
ncbi:MAG: DUF4349 domain-containing protein [Candidatus Fermentithermobacillus carboniphilus]|uniref:Anti-sigma-W factor RsiW n=1 Tax=Candidatus Fermentithermobacillus carboniphilus TaxID=3085328 RepID=A0AAT9LAI3_9FIRM|nr:MAG: DUF4349 domain-containing protein [Candidatus Fermentithermobacillus carboniphilus]